MIDKPLPPREEVKKESPPKTAAQPAAKEKPTPAGKPSTADILAAARGKTAPAPAAGEKKRPSTADILAAARGKAPAAEAPAKAEKPAAPAPSGEKKKLSTADILAAARQGKAEEPVAQPTESVAEDRVGAFEPEPIDEPPSVPERMEVKPAAAEAEPQVKPTAQSSGTLPTTTAERIAWCREHDGKA